MNQPTPNLTLSVGETVLSWHEAAALKAGDVLLTHREAGFPSILLLDHLPVALAEVMVIDGTFGARVVDTDFRPPFRVEPGRTDLVGEALPALVTLGDLAVDPYAVAGLGRHSLVRFAASAEGPDDADLWFAGQRLARGKVVVVGERMGLRITARLIELTAEGRGLPTGTLVEGADLARVKDFDFTRPDRWTWAQIHRFETLHRRTAALQGGGEVWIDQMNGAEALEWWRASGLGPLSTWEHFAFRPRTPWRPRVTLLEDPRIEASRALGPEGLAWIETWYGEDSAASRGAVWIAVPPGAEVAAAAAALRQGWRPLLDFALVPRTTGVSEPAPHEMVLVAAGRDLGGRLLWAAIYPYLTLEPYANLLGA